MTDQKLNLIIAKSAGTCFGVKAAIALAERHRKPILGPIVHNPQIVKELNDQGIDILERYEDIDSLNSREITEVVITAHGYPKEKKIDLSKRGIKYHDATCPVLLKWVYKKIENFTSQGFHIILIGNPKHAEIIASRSYGKDISVVYSKEEIDQLDLRSHSKVVAICQTTITEDKFRQLVNYIKETKYPDLKVVDTRCKPVKNQQEAVQDLAAWVDAMLIVGGYNSSNTTNLAKLASKFLPKRTHHIDSADCIQKEWLQGVQNLGIGAGTSTPQEQIIAVEEKVRELFDGEVLVSRDESHDDEVIEEI